MRNSRAQVGQEGVAVQLVALADERRRNELRLVSITVHVYTSRNANSPSHGIGTFLALEWPNDQILSHSITLLGRLRRGVLAAYHAWVDQKLDDGGASPASYPCREADAQALD